MRLNKYHKRGMCSINTAIQCPICGELVDLFTIAHVSKHGMTRDEFLDKYPEFDSTAYWPLVWGTIKCKYPKCKNNITSVRYMCCSKHKEEMMQKELTGKP